MADQDRQKNFGGEGKHVGRRGEGLGTGPVGRKEGYQGRPGTTSARPTQSFTGTQSQQSSDRQVTRGFGGKGLIIVIALVALLVLGGGGGLLGGLSKAFPGIADTHIYQLLDMFSNAALTFLPILIAISAAKIFGANV